MAHEYGHARPLWGIQQLKDFWEWEKHPWNVPVPEDYEGVYPTESQWEARYRKPESFQMSAGPGAAGLRQVSKQIAGAGGWPGQGRGETQEAQMARIRRAREGAHDYPMALARDQWGMYGQAKKDIAAGKFESDPIEDEYDKLLKMLFLQSLLGGTAGGDPPNIGAVTVGSSRDFVPLPAMVPQPFGGYS